MEARKIVIEVKAGCGGADSTLFAKDLFLAILKYCDHL